MKLRAACLASLHWLCALALVALALASLRRLCLLLPPGLRWPVPSADQSLLLAGCLLLRALARSLTFAGAGFFGRRLIEYRLARFARLTAARWRAKS